jgi:glycosyltransferase involved in cell wall biosynthesis
MPEKKLAIITSHPIQYNAPLFSMLAKQARIELKVFYTWGEDSMKEKYDPDFQQIIKWDIPLLEGYNYTFLENTSKNPGSHHFKGIINPKLNQEIEAWNADIVWIWGWAFDSHLKALRYFKGKKEVWFRGDSTLLDEPKGVSLKKLARRIFLTWVYRYVDKVFYVGTNNKAYFKKHRLKETQLFYAPHAIDNNRFSDSKGEKIKKALEWRKKLGFQDDDIVLLFAGKFEPRKNPFFLIDLIKSLESDKVKLLIVGNGPLEYKLRQDLDNHNCVKFLGFQNQSNMPILYRLANFYLLPSVSETWGLAINEALVSGTKVIASKYCGGSIDLINDSNGMIFDPKSELKLVCKYIIQKENNILSLRGSDSLLDGHSYNQITKKIINTLFDATIN